MKEKKRVSKIKEATKEINYFKTKQKDERLREMNRDKRSEVKKKRKQ